MSGGGGSADIGMVVFDLGGVIVRICRSIVEAGARAGIAVPADELTAEKRAARKAIHAEYERGRITCDEFFPRISATTGGRVSAEQMRLIHDAWLIDEYAGVSELIDDLHAAGVETGVLSNTNAWHWGRQMMASDGARFVAAKKPRHKHASHLLGLAKPDAMIYRTFAERVSVEAARMVFFDDLEENVNAARACGWHAERIDHTGDTAAQMRAWLVTRGVLERSADAEIIKR